MSSDHQDTLRPPTATGELHRQPPSSTDGNTLLTTVNSVLTNSTPKSNLAAAFTRAFFNIPTTSFHDASTAAVTPPMVTRNNPLRRSLSDASDYHYQPPWKTPRVSSSPQSSTGKQKQSPQSERLRQMKDMVREIEHRCREIMNEEAVAEEISNPPLPQEEDECVGVERLKNGDLRFELSCCCGKKFEMLIKNNGYCFYRLI